MAIWVDRPIWPAHGRLWAHVVSDTSLAELHAFAAAAGIPSRSFEGDHYDIPAERHTDVLAAGARLTSAGDLARRLRDSGLRFRKRRGERPLARVRDGLAAVGGPHVLDVVLSPHEPPASAGAAVVLVGVRGDRLVLVRSTSREGWAPPGGKRDRGESVREGAVRELAEETGLVVPAEVLAPVGYERITILDGDQIAPWDAGDNHIAVFGLWLDEPRPVAPLTADVDAAQWVTIAQARERCGAQHWWPLVEHWWS